MRGSVHLRGMAHAPSEFVAACLVVAHGRSNDLRNPLVRRLAEDAASTGVWVLRSNLRGVDAKQRRSRDLSTEEDDLRGAVACAHQAVREVPIFVAGKSM